MEKQPSWKVIIGMEVHVQPKTESKMFCECKNDPFCKDPNIHTCPVCMALPGSLPVANEKAIEEIIKLGVALNSKIASYSCFARKSYFYPDLPKGYQISQYDKPFCQGGELSVNGKKIKITRIHLEEDAGKNFHPKGTDYTLVDLNRAGVPLIELVTEPDIESAEEAKLFCQELQLVLRYLKISDADMEKGQMRCEANISLVPKGTLEKDKLSGTKVEVKNLNSFKAVERSIEFEIKRQSRILERGEKVVAETRGWSEGKQGTVSQRSKEEASEYRYFPEPDLPPILVDPKDVEKLRDNLPELPQEFRKRLRDEYKLAPSAIEAFTCDKNLGNYFEEAGSELRAWWEDTSKEKFSKDIYQLLANYLITEIKKYLSVSKTDIKDLLVTPENLAELIVMLYENKINSSAAQTILAKMLEKGSDPDQIAKELDLLQISDNSALTEIVEKVLSNNPQAIEDLKSGKEQILQYLIGQVMKETRGKANPKVVDDMIREKIFGK